MKLYKNKNWLYEQYIIKKLSSPKIARICNTGKTTILTWLKKFNIPTRTIKEATSGVANWRWKGGRKKDKSGYVMIWKPEHPYRDYTKYVPEHRLIVEKRLDRYLLPGEEIHHKNGIKDDNRDENLQLFDSKSEHRRFENNAKLKTSDR